MEAARIADTLTKIYKDADAHSISTHESANRFAENRIKSIRELKTLSTFDQSFFGHLKH